MATAVAGVGVLAILGGLAAGCGSSSTVSGTGGAPSAPSAPSARSPVAASLNFYSGTSPATSPNSLPSASTSTSPSLAGCSRSAHRSGSTVTVGLADDTSTVCLVVGEQLRVVLPADAKGAWAQVGVVGPALSRPDTSLGVAGGSETVATTRATGPGTGRVLAVQSCPGQQGCSTWVVEVRVRSGR